MGRIATTEDIEGIRDEQDIGDEGETFTEESNEMDVDEAEEPHEAAPRRHGKYIATMQQVHNAFDSINTLRYSQPTHLQGGCISTRLGAYVLQENVRVSR